MNQELLKASNRELLEAAILFYEKYNPGCGKWMELGFKLNGKDAWKYVAPAWIQKEND